MAESHPVRTNLHDATATIPERYPEAFAMGPTSSGGEMQHPMPTTTGYDRRPCGILCTEWPVEIPFGPGGKNMETYPSGGWSEGARECDAT